MYEYEESRKIDLTKSEYEDKEPEKSAKRQRANLHNKFVNCHA